MNNAALNTTHPVATPVPSMGNMDQQAVTPTTESLTDHSDMQHESSSSGETMDQASAASVESTAMLEQSAVNDLLINDPLYQEYLQNQDKFRKYLQDEKDKKLHDRRKALGNDYISKRNSLIIRRLGKEKRDELAPLRDVLAYSDIYEMKRTCTDNPKGIRVSDDEIRAFLELKGDSDDTPSLDNVLDKVKGLKGATGVTDADIDEDDGSIEDVE